MRTRARLNDVYVFHTGQELSEIERVIDRDFFMDVNQAMEFGVIDSVLDKRLGRTMMKKAVTKASRVEPKISFIKRVL